MARVVTGHLGLVLALLAGTGVLVLTGTIRPAGLICRARPPVDAPAGSLLATEVWL